jgi:hypothetical protein
VLNEDGRPVAGAVVEPFGFGKANGTHYGGLKGFDALALTDAGGAFRLGVPEPGLAVYVRVNAPFMAPGLFRRLTAGPQVHELTLLSGVTVTGRLVHDGKPLAGVGVGVVQKDHSADTFVGEFQAATDADGVFRVVNVPPGETLVLYGLMESLRRHGALAARDVRTGKSRSVTDVGDMRVTAGHRLSGRVVLSDGKPVPAGTRVLLSRDEAWDSQQAVVDAQGRFEFTGLPAECFGLSANVRGYHASPRNASFDLLNGFQLLGTVRADTVGLRLLLRPGPEAERAPFDDRRYAEYERRRRAPLRGAPEGGDGAPAKR